MIVDVTKLDHERLKKAKEALDMIEPEARYTKYQLMHLNSALQVMAEGGQAIREILAVPQRGDEA